MKKPRLLEVLAISAVGLMIFGFILSPWFFIGAIVNGLAAVVLAAGYYVEY